MNKTMELENALTDLFRKGMKLGYTSSEISEYLDEIDFNTLLQAVWNNAETVYVQSARASGH